MLASCGRTEPIVVLLFLAIDGTSLRHHIRLPLRVGGVGVLEVHGAATYHVRVR